MDITHPINTLIPSLAGPVLEVLAGTTRPLSGREVTRLLSVEATDRGVQRVLDRLVEGGLVLQDSQGSALLHTLNRDHILAPVVLAAARAYRTLVEGLTDVVGDLTPRPVHAALFGSVARRQAGPDSDVDCVLVWSNEVSDEAVAEAEDTVRSYVERSTGNRCQIVSYRADEYDSLAETSPEFWANLKADSLQLLNG